MKKNERIIAKLASAYEDYSANPNQASLSTLLDVVAKTAYYLMEENIKNNLHND
jgi:hypothetical protein